jgi:hypothetical protein
MIANDVRISSAMVLRDHGPRSARQLPLPVDCGYAASHYLKENRPAGLCREM